MTVRREVYERLGGFFGVTYGEDWEMWVRIASRYEVAYTPQVLVEYRVHPGSISADKFRTGEYLRDLFWVIRTIQAYLPDGIKERVRDIAAEHYAKYGLKTAEQTWRESGNKEAAELQIMEAVRMWIDPEMYKKLLQLYADMLFNKR